MRRVTTIKVRAPRGAERKAWESRGLVAHPVGRSYNPRSLGKAMLHPTEDRAFHEAYARQHGYFWIPCPRCGVMFGGHEVGIAVDFDGEDFGRCICTACTIVEIRRRP